METIQAVREITPLPNRTFPINVFFLPSPFFIHTHWHEHFEIIYMIAGTATIRVDSQFKNLESGDSVFVNSRQIHGSSHESPDARMVAVVFNESLLRNTCLDSTEITYILPALRGELAFENFLCRHDKIGEDISESLDRMILEFCLDDVGSELLIKSELFRILGLMIKYRSRNAANQTKQSDLERALQQLVQEMSSDLSNCLTVTEAAARINVSVSHFCRLFRRMTGTTLVQYRNHLRIQTCEKLLKTTTLNVTEIAYRMGFANTSHFEKVFRQFKGTTPCKYRDRYFLGRDENIVQTEGRLVVEKSKKALLG